MIRIVQAGTGTPRAMVALFLLDPSMDGKVREALGPLPCILADVRAPVGLRLKQLVALVRERTKVEVGLTVVGGWSLGCSHPLRDMLIAGDRPDVVVAADGTTADYPTPTPARIGAWQVTVDRARRGESVFLVSHTYNTYTERLRLPESSPFFSTVGLLRKVTGLPLIEPAVGETAEVHDRGLHVYSFQSGDCDDVAHTRQVREALPMMLARHVRPMVEGEEVPAALPPPSAPTSSPPASFSSRTLHFGVGGGDVAAWQRWLTAHGFLAMPFTLAHFDTATRAATRRFQNAGGLTVDGIVGPASRAKAGTWPAPEVVSEDGAHTWKGEGTIGERAVRWALQYAGREDLEDQGPNRSEEVAVWLAPGIRRATGSPLRLTSGEWCAAFFCASARAVGGVDAELPHSYRVSGVELRDDARVSEAWHTPAEVIAGTWTPSPGDGVILRRGAAWETHTCRMVRWDGGDFWTVGGNEGNTVRVSHHNIHDADIIGFIAYPTA